jgi:hypothetical protein
MQIMNLHKHELFFQRIGKWFGSDGQKGKHYRILSLHCFFTIVSTITILSSLTYDGNLESNLNALLVYMLTFTSKFKLNIDHI